MNTKTLVRLVTLSVLKCVGLELGWCPGWMTRRSSCGTCRPRLMWTPSQDNHKSLCFRGWKSLGGRVPEQEGGVDRLLHLQAGVAVPHEYHKYLKHTQFTSSLRDQLLGEGTKDNKLPYVARR